jgi:hypothetical protein
MRILLFILFFLSAVICRGQDSATAVYINEIVQKIEARIATDIVETKDTIIYDEGDSLKKGAYLTVRTLFYTDPKTMLLDKIVEKSVYKKIATELTVYFFGNQPVLFSSRQKEGTVLKADFDIYYMNDNYVYCTKRNNLTGTPDSDTYLKWCYQLKNEYLRVVQEYNQVFASRKSKSR